MNSKIFGLAFLIAFVGGIFYLWSSPSGLNQAPVMTVQTLDGKNIQIGNNDKPILINFWATSCPSCIKEMPALAKLHTELQAQGFQVVAVAMEYDPENHVRKFADARNLPFPIVMDKDGAISKGFGTITLTPTNILIGPNGKIAFKKIGEPDFEKLKALIQTL